jgi:hypothetical protein
MTDIDKLGEEVAAQIKSAEADRVKIAPGLCRVWAELEAKHPVNGVKTKGAGAEKVGITLRYCQYIVKEPKDLQRYYETWVKHEEVS